jgi:general stress protein 26
MNKPPTDTKKREHLRKIINGAHTGLFVTHTIHGLHGRPMANAEVDDVFEVIWFATKRSSAKIDELQHDSRVFLGYQKSGTEWATVNGRARVVDDRAKAHELWSPLWRNWFTDADDPDLVLIQVTPESAEYWDSGNKLVAMVKFAVGAVTEPMDQGDHQKLAMT